MQIDLDLNHLFSLLTELSITKGYRFSYKLSQATNKCKCGTKISVLHVIMGIPPHLATEILEVTNSARHL